MPETLHPRIAAHSPREHRTIIAAGSVATLTLAADQIVKLLVENHYRLHESTPVIAGVFSITHVRNLGAAWSMFSGFGWLLLLVALAVSVGILIFFRYLAEGWVERYYALMLILAGTVGNSIDRLWRGAVVDFIDVHWYDVWHYPVFNLADIAICVGVGIFILSNLLRRDINRGGE